MSGEDGDALCVAATAEGEPEAELIRQRLAQAGITAVIQRTIGGPEFGAAGSRYVYVTAAELELARSVLSAEPES